MGNHGNCSEKILSFDESEETLQNLLESKRRREVQLHPSFPVVAQQLDSYECCVLRQLYEMGGRCPTISCRKTSIEAVSGSFDSIRGSSMSSAPHLLIVHKDGSYTFIKSSASTHATHGRTILRRISLLGDSGDNQRLYRMEFYLSNLVRLGLIEDDTLLDADNEYDKLMFDDRVHSYISKRVMSQISSMEFYLKFTKLSIRLTEYGRALCSVCFDG